MKMLLRLALVVAAVVLVPTAGASAATWQYFDFDADAAYDAAAIDRTGNGSFDDIYFDLDNDTDWDTNLYNARGTGDWLLEYADYDMDENGEVEARLGDGDQRAGFDYVWVDRDQNGHWDQFRGGARRIVPGSNLDLITRTQRYNANSQILNDFYRWTGTSLLYPSFPVCC